MLITVWLDIWYVTFLPGLLAGLFLLAFRHNGSLINIDNALHILVTLLQCIFSDILSVSDI